MGLHKIIRIIALLLALAGIIFAFMLVSGNEGQIGSMLTVAYIILALVLASVIIFTLMNLIAHPAALKSTLTGVGAFAAVGLICYFLLASGVETDLRDGKTLSAGGSKLVGAGLYMFYALALIAIGSMLFFGIKKMSK